MGWESGEGDVLLKLPDGTETLEKVTCLKAGMSTWSSFDALKVAC